MAVTATVDSNSGTNTVVGSTSQGRTNIVVKAGAEAATTIVNLTDVYFFSEF